MIQETHQELRILALEETSPQEIQQEQVELRIREHSQVVGLAQEIQSLRMVQMMMLHQGMKQSQIIPLRTTQMMTIILQMEIPQKMIKKKTRKRKRTVSQSIQEFGMVWYGVLMEMVSYQFLEMISEWKMHQCRWWNPVRRKIQMQIRKSLMKKMKKTKNIKIQINQNGLIIIALLNQLLQM